MLPRLLTTRPQQNLLNSEVEVAPVLGMDGTVPLHNMNEGVAVYSYNLLPSEYGCRTPAGYRVWAQNISSGAPVKTLLPFSSQVYGGVSNRLFAVTSLGIYNLTAQGEDNPILVETFADQTDEAGFCSFIHHTNDNGDQVLLMADSRNGMYEYNPVGEVWTKYTTEITGADPTQVAFIMAHKERIWLIERNSADAWYLDPGARAGVATRFQFGSKMRYGGFLVGLYAWTVDGGDGVDDYLLGISKAGDVLAYRGSDPSSASTWDMVGRWYVGEVPENRRIATESGGDTIILSSFGLTSVTRLLSGLDPSQVERNVSAKITRFVRNALEFKGGLPYWEIKPLRSENLLVVNSPKLENENHIQYALNLNRLSEQSGGGWGLLRHIPATTFESYGDKTYFGTEDGRVCEIGGELNNVDISGDGGDPIEFSMLTRFTNYGTSDYKQVQFSEAVFLSQNVIAADTLAVYDFTVDEGAFTPAVDQNAGAYWDVSLWDQTLWSGQTIERNTEAHLGYGRSVAIAIKGESISRSTLINVSLNWSKWDFL